jgi:hypothetical protein
MIKVTVTGADKAFEEINKALQKFMTEKVVTVGIHEDENARDSGTITNAQLGAVHEFGADIDHPGGTPYGYATKADAEKGRVKFLKTGSGFMELGVTEAHKIKISARPWLVPGVESGNVEYLKIIQNTVKDGGTLEEALNKVGVVAVAKVQRYMRDLKTPPNSASTIARKGSSNPLIDSGALRQSVDYKLQDVKPNEGI